MVGLGFLHGHARLWLCHSSFRLSLCHRPQSSPQVCPINPQFQPPLTPANVCLRLGRQGQWHDQLSTLCSACHKPITALSSEPLKPLFYPDWSPCQWRGFRGSRDISAFSVPSQGHRSYLTSSFFPFFPTQSCGIFLVLSGIWGLLLVFCRCSVRIVPFLDYFWCICRREGGSTSFSTILIEAPPESGSLRGQSLLKILSCFW